MDSYEVLKELERNELRFEILISSDKEISEEEKEEIFDVVNSIDDELRKVKELNNYLSEVIESIIEEG